MPKVKDLGVTVVPEQFGPMEVGGGGCYGSFCTDCTNVQFSICGTTPGPKAQAARGCTDCTMQQFSICGTSPGRGGGCSDCTFQNFSICGTTPGCGCTNVFSNCPFTPFFPCGLTPFAPPCRMVSCAFTPGDGPCTVSWDPWGQRPGGGLTQQGIDQIRQQLQAQLAQLDEAEKALAPQTAADLDAREKQLSAELDKIKAARASMKKK